MGSDREAGNRNNLVDSSAHRLLRQLEHARVKPPPASPHEHASSI